MKAKLKFSRTLAWIKFYEPTAKPWDIFTQPKSQWGIKERWQVKKGKRKKIASFFRHNLLSRGWIHFYIRSKEISSQEKRKEKIHYICHQKIRYLNWLFIMIIMLESYDQSVLNSQIDEGYHNLFTNKKISLFFYFYLIILYQFISKLFFY